MGGGFLKPSPARATNRELLRAWSAWAWALEVPSQAGHEATRELGQNSPLPGASIASLLLGGPPHPQTAGCCPPAWRLKAGVWAQAVLGRRSPHREGSPAPLAPTHHPAAAGYSSRRPRVRPGPGPTPGNWIHHSSWREPGRRVPRGSQAAGAGGGQGGGRRLWRCGGCGWRGHRRGATSPALIGLSSAAPAGNCCFGGGKLGVLEERKGRRFRSREWGSGRAEPRVRAFPRPALLRGAFVLKVALASGGELGEKPQKSPGILTKIQSVLRTSPWGAGSGRGFRKSSGGSSRDLGEGVKMGWRQGSR